MTQPTLPTIDNRPLLPDFDADCRALESGADFPWFTVEACDYRPAARALAQCRGGRPMNEARCSVNWKMFAPNGAQMQFTVRDDDPDLHLALLDSYLEALYLRGYSVTEPGLNAGEKQEEINGYVLGESKKGDACVYLYSSESRAPVAHRHRLR